MSTRLAGTIDSVNRQWGYGVIVTDGGQRLKYAIGAYALTPIKGQPVNPEFTSVPSTIGQRVTFRVIRRKAVDVRAS